MKLLDSAVANAEHNDNVPEEELYVARAFADEGPTMKRWRPRARGRGTRIRKRTSHITLIVARYEDVELDRRRQRDAADNQAQRASRRRRVQGSQRKAEREAAREAEHDHDHEDHEHDDEIVDEVDGDEVEADDVDEVEVDDDRDRDRRRRDRSCRRRDRGGPRPTTTPEAEPTTDDEPDAESDEKTEGSK